MKYIKHKIENHFAFISLDRPDKGNCYHYQMALELTQTFQKLFLVKDVYAIILQGEGKHFCTGADLEWMKEASGLSQEENVKDLEIVKKMYESILACDIPLIVVAKGKVRGGGVGLAACGDIVISHDSSSFSLSEVKLGLIPGIISPILIQKLGTSVFSEMALTGREISNEEAKITGLIHHVCSASTEKEVLTNILSLIAVNSIESMRMIKKSVKDFYGPDSNIFQEFLKLSAVRRSDNDFLQRLQGLKKN